MKKTVFTVALACVLSIGGLTASAENYNALSKVSFDNDADSFSAKGSETLRILMANPKTSTSDSIGLSDFLNAMAYNGEREFGYMYEGKEGSKFVSLAEVLSDIKADGVASVSLGRKFERKDTIQFGYADKDGKNFRKAGVEKIETVKVESDAGFHGGFDADSFFRLDFAEEPFDGNIELLVVGEPLPASTVTLLIALAAGAGFLLYSNRRQRASRIEQA